MPVYIFVEQIAKRPRTARIAGLRAKGAQPHEISGLHFDPILIELINRLAFEHI